MVTTVRNLQVNDNAYMKVYRAMEERGLALAFHSGPNWGEPVFRACNRFISVHALGFPFYNILHCTNWVINGMGERFPKLPVIWIEAGLAWIPFLMQRLDHEYMMRPSEAPLLKKKPCDYMRDMYYSSQPMEIQDLQGAWRCTFRMINAETQLLYASDYPHWDFDLPTTIYDLPFLSEKAKHNILGGTAARLFKLPPRNEKQKTEPDQVRQSGSLSVRGNQLPHVTVGLIQHHTSATVTCGLEQAMGISDLRTRESGSSANPSSAVHPLPHNLIASLPRLVCQGDGCAGQAL